MMGVGLGHPHHGYAPRCGRSDSCDQSLNDPDVELSVRSVTAVVVLNYDFVAVFGRCGQWLEIVVASAAPRPAASASSKQASALVATGSSACSDAANWTAVARSFLAALRPNAVSPSGWPLKTLAMTAPRPFIAVGVPAVSERMSISRSAGRLSGLQMVKASPSACQ